MAWTPGTSTHIFRLQKTYPEFDRDPLLRKSIEAVSAERGRYVGPKSHSYLIISFAWYCPLSRYAVVQTMDTAMPGSVYAHIMNRYSILGAVASEYRSTNFGPPLFCKGQRSFYHLNSRKNKSGTDFDTQWLFPRDIFPRRGKHNHYSLSCCCSVAKNWSIHLWFVP
jgi:hypothetical protein